MLCPVYNDVRVDTGMVFHLTTHDDLEIYQTVNVLDYLGINSVKVRDGLRLCVQISHHMYPLHNVCLLPQWNVRFQAQLNYAGVDVLVNKYEVVRNPSSLLLEPIQMSQALSHDILRGNVPMFKTEWVNRASTRLFYMYAGPLA